MPTSPLRNIERKQSNNKEDIISIRSSSTSSNSTSSIRSNNIIELDSFLNLRL